MDKQVETCLLAYFDSIDEQDFQQRKIQVEEHVQHATPHQYLDNIQMKKN